jgi:acyl transferase domain-containing protein
VESKQQDSMNDSYDIAVIGMAGRFPGSKDISAYWQTIRDGLDRVSFFSDDELEVDGLTAEEMSNPEFVKARAIIDDVELFDASFFNVLARTAEWMDPQQRLFLEYVWNALEDAGYDASTYTGAIALYAGSSLNSYMLSRLSSLAESPDAPDAFQIVVNNDKDHLATRVSYKLNLRGESVSIQTSCSTSLVAVHFACQSLLGGQCDIALAGGVSILIPQKTGYLYQEGMISSPDGHCRAFDDKAQGTVSGNGLGVVVLKMLTEAVKDGDHIYAVIKGSAINNDGNLKMGYTAPSIQGQTDVISKALAMAGVPADTIDYVEAHGTGTPVGDPIEVEALTQAYRRHTDRKQFCALGSVKANIGHLDVAAGIAGLIKACLSLKHQEIPPLLHFEKPNRTIDFQSSPFYLNDTLLAWPRRSTPRRAAVSSFGIGGTNAHVILEEAPSRPASGESRPCQVLTLSAKSPQALANKAEMLARHLEDNPQLNLADIAYTCNVGRQQFPYRRFLLACDRNDALGALAVPAGANATAAMSASVPASSREARVAFLFPGQGAQSVEMAKSLYMSEPEFRRHVDDCALMLKKMAGPDVLQLLYPADGETAETARRLAQPEFTLPALFIIEYALARLWMSWGVRPYALLGHSFGEYIAACLAGVFTLAEALMLAMERGRLMQRLEPGAMVAVRLPEAEAGEFLTGDLAMAAVNSRQSVVISGPLGDLEKLAASLTRKQIGFRRLDVPFAYHSAMIDPLLPDFAALIAKINLKAPTIAYVSGLTGKWIQADEATNPDYWVRQMRQPVRFADSLDTLMGSKCEVFLEVGPGRTLSALAGQHIARDKNILILPSLPRASAASAQEAGTLQALGKMWMAGCEIDWQSFYSQEHRHRLSLPTYPFERQRYWIETGGKRNVPSLPHDSESQSESRSDAQLLVAGAGADSGLQRHHVERTRLTHPFTGPRNRIEETMAGIWSEVLGLEGIGMDDDFYELGGDSLLATQVYARLSQHLSPAITLQQVLSHQTIAGLAQVIGQEIEMAGQQSGAAAPYMISPTPRDTELPVSFSQQRLWFIYQHAPDSSVYNLGDAIRMSGRLNIEALERSLNEIVRRHEVLRTRFVSRNGQLMQAIEPFWRVPLSFTDLGGLPETEREERVRQLAREEAQMPFDLTQGPLLRVHLIKLDEEEHVALFCMHHIISDGWSFGVLVREVSALYEAFSLNQPSSLPELPIQYADFAAWQRQQLQGAAFEARLDYWKRQLGGSLPFLNLPTDRPRPIAQTFQGANEFFTLTPEATLALKALARQEGTTLYTLLLAAFQTLLHRYTEQDDIIVGSPIAGRNMVETEGLIGLFINTLALRSDCSGNPMFRQFLRAVRETTRNAFANQELPFELVVEALQPERSLSHNPLFQVFFNFQNTPAQFLEIRGLTLSRLEFDNRAVALDLILNMIESGEQLNGAIQYSTSLFDASTIVRMIGRFEKLLHSIAAQPDTSLKALEMYTDAEQQQQATEESAKQEAVRGSLRSARRRSIDISSDKLPTPVG